jgi:hypothetical protein
MRLLRSRLPALVLAWLACQFAALASAPVVFACTDVTVASELHECCKNLAPGQTCPMHHTPHDEENTGDATDERGGCVMRSTCDADADVAVLALAGTLGIAGSTQHAVSFHLLSVIQTADPLTPLSLHLPDAPPPRA